MLPTFDLELYKLLLLSKYYDNSLKRANQVMYLSGQVLLYLFYTIFMLYTSALIISMEICICKHTHGSHSFRFDSHTADAILTNPVIVMNIKLIYIVLFCMGILKYQLCLSRPFQNKSSTTPLRFVFGKFRKRFSRYFCFTSLWCFLLNFLLITIINPNLLNPGPKELLVYYQNVQGLIPFSALADSHPNLNINKVLELQAHLNINKPDVVVLNETWLKKSILDSEILPADQYKVFRLDRSRKTHPLDPLDPKKFREYGGGVLIGIRTDLDVVSKEVKFKRGAEMLVVQISLSNGMKYVISTCYRVGTLGMQNHDIVMKSLRSVLCKSKPPKVIFVGDLNLSAVSWTNMNSPVPIEQTFVDSFNELGLKQIISEPTHLKGNILDVLLTNYDSAISNLSILEHDSVCKSDHFPIHFNICCNVKRKKPVKRQGYNFKRANWDRLNHDLLHVDWDSLFRY